MARLGPRATPHLAAGRAARRAGRGGGNAGRARCRLPFPDGDATARQLGDSDPTPPSHHQHRTGDDVHRDRRLVVTAAAAAALEHAAAAAAAARARARCSAAAACTACRQTCAASPPSWSLSWCGARAVQPCRRGGGARRGPGQWPRTAPAERHEHPGTHPGPGHVRQTPWQPPRQRAGRSGRSGRDQRPGRSVSSPD